MGERRENWLRVKFAPKMRLEFHGTRVVSRRFSLKHFKIKSVLVKTLFSLVVFLVFIAALEIILRTTHLFGARISWTQPDYILGWRFSAGCKYWFNKENNHPITGTINSFGWRDREWSIQKPAHTYRIAVLGDSFVAAFDVESDRTFLALAEHQLNADRDAKVEFMNFGRPGFTQTEELIVLKGDVARFFPDMVLLFFFPGNDIQEVSEQTSHYLLRPFYHISENGKLILDTKFVETTEFKIKCFLTYLKQHSALLSFLGERYNSYKQEKQVRSKTNVNTLGQEARLKKFLTEDWLSLCTNNPDSTYLENYQLNKILIKAMSEYCKAKGIRFVLITLDIPPYMPEVEKQFKLINPTFDANFLEDDLRNFAESIDIEYLGLQRVFRRFFEDTGIPLHWRVRKKWGHWNYEGHKAVADALVNKLEPIIYSNEDDG